MKTKRKILKTRDCLIKGVEKNKNDVLPYIVGGLIVINSLARDLGYISEDSYMMAEKLIEECSSMKMSNEDIIDLIVPFEKEFLTLVEKGELKEGMRVLDKMSGVMYVIRNYGKISNKCIDLLSEIDSFIEQGYRTVFNNFTEDLN